LLAVSRANPPCVAWCTGVPLLSNVFGLHVSMTCLSSSSLACSFDSLFVCVQDALQAFRNQYGRVQRLQSSVCLCVRVLRNAVSPHHRIDLLLRCSDMFQPIFVVLCCSQGAHCIPTFQAYLHVSCRLQTPVFMSASVSLRVSVVMYMQSHAWA